MIWKQTRTRGDPRKASRNVREWALVKLTAHSSEKWSILKWIKLFFWQTVMVCMFLLISLSLQGLYASDVTMVFMLSQGRDSSAFLFLKITESALFIVWAKVAHSLMHGNLLLFSEHVQSMLTLKQVWPRLPQFCPFSYPPSLHTLTVALNAFQLVPLWTPSLSTEHPLLLCVRLRQ